MNFRLDSVGETIYFKNPDDSRYLDAVAFGGTGKRRGHGPLAGSAPMMVSVERQIRPEPTTRRFAKAMSSLTS